MIITTTRSAAPSPDGNDPFRNSESLRRLLHRLHSAGEHAWAHDPAATKLMQFTRDKYANLARRHDLDPWEAVTAAFHVMRAKSTREAADPWGVITHAVRITCIYEERAQGLLCSVHQARRAHVSKFHDPDRFTARAHPIVDDHPILAAIEERYGNAEAEPDYTSTPVLAAVERAIQLLVLLGWPAEVARSGVEQICDALVHSGSHHSAHEYLRRDKQVRTLLDIPSSSWSVLLWVMLGRPEPIYATTNLGRGVLMRLLIGESVPLLLRYGTLVEALVLATPGVGRRSGMSDDKGVIIEWSVAAIQVGNRHRRDHGEMNPLTASIDRHGLLQPITITRKGS